MGDHCDRQGGHSCHRYTFLLDRALQHRQPILLVGPSGTGKTCIIAAHLLSGKGLSTDQWTPVVVTLSARTSANALQDQVTECLYYICSTSAKSCVHIGLLPACDQVKQEQYFLLYRLMVPWTNGKRACMAHKLASVVLSLWMTSTCLPRRCTAPSHLWSC